MAKGCTGCGKGGPNRASPISGTREIMPPTQNTDEMIMVVLNDGNTGQHSIHGALSKTFYGYRSSGETFMVTRGDQQAQPHKFVIEQEARQIAPLAVEAVVPLPPPPPPQFDFTKLYGINEERAEEIRKRGVRTLNGLVALGLEQLKSFLPAKTAKKVLEEAESLLEK